MDTYFIIHSHPLIHLYTKKLQVILTLKDDQVLERDEHGNVVGAFFGGCI